MSPVPIHTDTRGLGEHKLYVWVSDVFFSERRKGF